MNNDEYDKIIEELRSVHPIDEMVLFTELNIGEKLKENSFLLVKYSELLLKEKSILSVLEDKYDMLVGKQYDFYKFESERELSKPEIEKYYLPKDDKVRQMKKILRNQKARVDFFDTCVKSLNQMGWRMKDFISVIKGY